MPFISVPKVKQPQSNWCWAACCESFIGYYEKKIKTQHEFLLLVGNSAFQEQMATHVHGEPLNMLADPNNFSKLLGQILGAPTMVHTYRADYAVQGRYSEDQIRGAIDKKKIFILGAKSHFMVLSGYGNKPGGEEEGLFFMDPFVGNYIWEPWEIYSRDAMNMVWLKGTGLD
jgi:hypothetical protein